MDKEQFEHLIEEALAGLPKEFKRHLENITVMVEPEASRETVCSTGGGPFSTLLGLYHGVPFKDRGPYYGNIPPDVIVIYQNPIEKICRTNEEIKEKVREVVLHEIGHYFGLSEEELRDIQSPKHSHKK